MKEFVTILKESDPHYSLMRVQEFYRDETEEGHKEGHNDPKLGERLADYDNKNRAIEAEERVLKLEGKVKELQYTIRHRGNLDLREIIRASGFKLGHLAEEIGIKQSTLSMKIKGVRPFTLEELDSLSQVLDVNRKVLRRAVGKVKT